MESLRRWPLICSKQKLARLTTVTSAFGGLLYLESPNGHARLRLQLAGAVESPQLDVASAASRAAWPQRSRAPGLWAEVRGRHVAFAVPAHAVRADALPLRQLVRAVRAWDRVVQAHHDLRGTDVNGCARELVVVDVQPRGNRIHAGYPVVVPYRKFMLLTDISQ